MAAHLNLSFWSNSESAVLLNPRLPMGTRDRIENAVKEHRQNSTIWLKSSGTESSRENSDKIVCIEKKSFLCAAQSVNNFYQINQSDIWLNTLPYFHVGGLSISARCFLSGAKEVYLEKWSAEDCFKSFVENKVSVVSLVPTQIYDLLSLDKKAPSSLRLVIVGGGALREDLYSRAIQQGWPLVPSYGMTETSAMIAGGELDAIGSSQLPRMKLLKHVQVSQKSDACILTSEALYKGYLFVSSKEVIWEPSNGAYKLDDLLDIKEDFVSVLGRESDLIKVLGETVNLNELVNIFKKISSLENIDVVIRAEPDERRGYKLTVFVESSQLEIDLKLFNESVMPFERIENIIFKEKFPRTELGKIIKHELNNS